MIKKDLIPKSNSWNYRIDAGNDLDLEKHLNQLVQIFDSKIEIINRVKKEQNLETVIQFVIDIDTHPESSTPYFSLNHKVIEFLYNTGTEMDYDLYKYDSGE
jgi:phosphorylcholine metabolism protein LicD